MRGLWNTHGVSIDKAGVLRFQTLFCGLRVGVICGTVKKDRKTWLAINNNGGVTSHTTRQDAMEHLLVQENPSIFKRG